MTAITDPEQPPKRTIVVQSLTGLKHILYLIVALFSFILFVVSSVVATYEKDTYGGYNPPVGELAFTGAFGTLFIPIFVWSQRVRPDTIINTIAAELGLCWFMWLFLLGGVGALTAQTYDLLECQNLFICRGFSTMMAFAWMSWIILSFMMAFKLMIIGNLWARQIPIDWFAPVKQVYKSIKTGGTITTSLTPADRETVEKSEHAEV